MYILAYTIESPEGDFYDQFTVFESKIQAKIAYERIIEIDEVYCAAISKIIDGTEPHWVETPEPTHFSQQKRYL